MDLRPMQLGPIVRILLRSLIPHHKEVLCLCQDIPASLRGRAGTCLMQAQIVRLLRLETLIAAILD